MRNLELDKINKTVTESNIHLCQYCGKEVDRRRIFCDEHNTDLNKQIYEFFVDIPLRPRGKYSYELIAAYLQSKIGLSKQKRFIVKAPSGSGKSITLDMIGYLELTHFPESFTIIGSVSYPVATEHIRRIRHWVRDSIFGKYIHGMEATASKEEITLERLHSRMLAIASQAETSRAGYHPCFDKETEVLTRAGWKNVA
ncbi:MAG: hypothetical protein KAR20_22050, partial [Candidatus Heimdallarchaeota archaeon]|nr:hypothetical protein [Candidatus Heimdallarchaeota archaeon]